MLSLFCASEQCFNFVLLTFAPSINPVTGKTSKFHNNSHTHFKNTFLSTSLALNTHTTFGDIFSCGLRGFKRNFALELILRINLFHCITSSIVKFIINISHFKIPPNLVLKKLGLLNF